VIITFDDGYADTFANAVPILQAHGMVGSFAVITGFVGTRDYASWQQVNAAQASGMEIVSHSFNHINFGSSAYQDSYREWSIAGAQSALAQDAGDRTRTFVYPYGHLTPGTEKILAAHGYTLAFTTTYGLVNLGGGASGSGQDPLALPRVRVSGGEPLDAFALSLNPSALQQATALSKLGAQQQGSAE
jgi:peptidoglycan/xylan/chitin deacetylase (PgdA/CDA1 family)